MGFFLLFGKSLCIHKCKDNVLVLKRRIQEELFRAPVLPDEKEREPKKGSNMPARVRFKKTLQRRENWILEFRMRSLHL